MALMGAGHFAGFTYIRSAATEVGGLAPDQLAALLLVYGVGIVAGNLVAGPLADRRMRLAVLLFPAVLGAAMIVLVLGGGSTGVLFVAAWLWDVGFGALPTTISTWLARAEPTKLESVGGPQTAVFQVAVALGAFAGGLLVDGAGAQTALLAGGAARLIGAAVMISIKPAPWRPAPERTNDRPAAYTSTTGHGSTNLPPHRVRFRVPQGWSSASTKVEEALGAANRVAE